MKLRDKIFYLGVFSILLIASIKYPFWLFNGTFADAPFIGVMVGITIYGALGASIYMFITEKQTWK